MVNVNSQHISDGMVQDAMAQRSNESRSQMTRDELFTYYNSTFSHNASAEQNTKLIKAHTGMTEQWYHNHNVHTMASCFVQRNHGIISKSPER